ncbi:hypothetical protein ACSTJP_01465 [Vibrio parahaemolyticus]|nr:hypothetical protein [Vibrio parahaemolyticus]HCH6293820.1 hypothetical protein [Vibrio parahaemolyticus]
METSVEQLNIWIPVISAVLGGLLVSLSSFLTLWYSKYRDQKSDADALRRERLEKIYRLLILVRSEQLDNYACNRTKNDEDKNSTSQKPMVELGLIINLYIKELTHSYESLQKATGDYALYLIHNSTKDGFNPLTDQELSELNLNVCGMVEKLIRQVSEISKA